MSCKVVHLPQQTGGRGDNSELLQFATSRKLIISLEKNSSKLISLAAMNTNFTNSVNISLKITEVNLCENNTFCHYLGKILASIWDQNL